jgi:hypothetical protein
MLVMFVAVFAHAFPFQATALVVDYGNFAANDVMFLAVTEDTDDEPAALFDPPELVGSNTLDFDPLRFTSSASSTTGTTEMSVVDGLLNFTLMSNDDLFDIMNVLFHESGDYALAGLGNSQANAKVEAQVDYAVTHVNGSMLSQALLGSGAIVFTPDGGDYTLGISNLNGQWTGSLDVDVRALLDGEEIAGAATKIEFTIDNILSTEVADGGSAFTAKKDFGISVLGELVPEPSGLSLLVLGLFACLQRCRRR